MKKETPAKPTLGLLLAWRPPDIDCEDRMPVGDRLVVGRSTSATWCITDRMLSRHHFSIVPDPENGGVRVHDLGSSNSTFVEGVEIEDEHQVPPTGLIRAGDCLFVVISNIDELTEPTGMLSTELVARFYSADLLRKLQEIARNSRHLLLEGESGYRKAAAAKTYHKLADKLSEHGRPGKLIRLNASSFTDEAKAMSVLFGAIAGEDTMARKGALQAARKGTFFLDEAQRLSEKTQQKLLRFVDDGLLHSREGHAPKKIDVRIILGTSPTGQKEPCLREDLISKFAKLDISPLRERRADIPSIFNYQLRHKLDPGTASSVLSSLNGNTMERLLLHEYREKNEQELVELVEHLEKLLLEGELPENALEASLEEVLGPDPRQE